MQYSPKLKRVMAEIDAILKREDIAGLVVLHTPGHAELLTRLDPSYSCAKIEANGQLRVRAKAEDFGGDVNKRNEVLRNTSNMLKLLTHSSGPTVVGLMETSEKLDKQLNAYHTGDGFSSNAEQNN